MDNTTEKEELLKKEKLSKKEKFYRCIFFVVGLAILSLGISLIIKSNFGTSAWDSVSIGLSKKFGLSIGIWLNIISVILIIISGILLNKIPRFSVLITSIVMGIGLDSWLFLMKGIQINSQVVSIVVFLEGVVIMGFGIATYLVSKLPPNPLDYFMLCVHEKFNISIAKARTICEIIGFILGIIVSGPIGIGTVIVMFSVGPVIGFFIKYTQKIYDNNVVVK